MKNNNPINFIIKNKELVKLFGIILIFLIFFISKSDHSKKRKIFNNSLENISFDNKFDYIHYQDDIITPRMKDEAGWILDLDEAYLINGLIRKYKPINILEIGVAKGGSSILILNAIKDFPNSKLISIDLHNNWKKQHKIGYLVEENFPELMGKWKLFTGDMSHKFLTKLNMKFDFFFWIQLM